MSLWSVQVQLQAFYQGRWYTIATSELGPTQPVPAAAAEVIALVNVERARYRLPPVTADARLMSAAQSWADHMARTRRLDHGNFGARLTASGYRWTNAAENIAESRGGAAAVVAVWMASPGHRRNILGPELRHVGVGVSGAYWCLDLAAGR